MDSDPAIKTEQIEHQAEVYNAHRDARYFALFWEMGLGKTKTVIDVASHLYLTRRIDALLIVAPKSVYYDLVSIEVPRHMAAPHVAMAWNTAGRRKEAARLRANLFLDPDEFPGRLRVVAISYPALRTDDGKNFVSMLLKIHRCMMVVDESTAISHHGTDQSKIVKKLGRLAHYKWICTGTPVAQSPFQAHSQIQFLDPDFWGLHGLRTYEAFKQEFGVYSLRTVGGGKKFNELQHYRNLDRLNRILAPISSRLLKEDSSVHLPPKMYTIRTFEMTDEQRAAYDALRDTYRAELDAGMYVEAPMAIVRVARLQQITSGFVTADEVIDDEPNVEDQLTLPYTGLEPGDVVDGSDFAEPVLRVTERRVVDLVPPADNPRLALLVDLVDACSHKVIVWCRFRRDVDLIVEALGDRCVRYDGKVRSADRRIALSRFRDADDPARVFVANVHAISQGVTLTIAKTMIYYSNSYSLERRLQSEDRFHRIGQDSPVHIIDLVARDTVDATVVDVLKRKFDVAAQVMGDRFRGWLR